MLIDILDNETAIGLSKEKLLGICVRVSSTIQENKVPTTAIPSRIL